jgi:energy-coupling factor transporter transmembrane protein EcfT
MNKKQTYDLYIFKKTTFLGACIGFAILLFSFIESDYNGNFLLSFIGLGIIVASIFTFAFGMCMNLMDEAADKSKGKNTSPSRENLYYFLEKRSYFY